MIVTTRARTACLAPKSKQHSPRISTTNSRAASVFASMPISSSAASAVTLLSARSNLICRCAPILTLIFRTPRRRSTPPKSISLPCKSAYLLRLVPSRGADGLRVSRLQRRLQPWLLVHCFCGNRATALIRSPPLESANSCAANAAPTPRVNSRSTHPRRVRPSLRRSARMIDKRSTRRA